MMATLASLLGGCQKRPETAYDAAQPRTAAVRNIGNRNKASRCMDDMFIAGGKSDVFLTTAGVPNATELNATETNAMFITAVSCMSAQSHTFRSVDPDPSQLDVPLPSELGGLHDRFVAPNYYARRTIYQLDPKSLATRFDRPGGTDTFAVLGSDREVGLGSPDRLNAHDLERPPVGRLDEIAARFRAIPGARADDAGLAVEVIR